MAGGAIQRAYDKRLTELEAKYSKLSKRSRTERKENSWELFLENVPAGAWDLIKKFNNFTEKDHQTRFFVSFSSMEKEKKRAHEYIGINSFENHKKMRDLNLKPLENLIN